MHISPLYPPTTPRRAAIQSAGLPADAVFGCRFGNT